jgi:hypothetical protein
MKDGKKAVDKMQISEARRRATFLRRTPRQQRRADHLYSSLPIPPGSIRRAILPYAHVGSLTINDIHRYIQRQGPGGYHLAASGFDDETACVLIEYLWAIDDLISPEIDRVALTKSRVAWLEVLARAEKLLPAPEIEALVNHHLLDIWDQVLSFLGWLCFPFCMNSFFVFSSMRHANAGA